MTPQEIVIERIGVTAAELCAELHSFSIEPAWDEAAFAALLQARGVAGFIAMRAGVPAGVALIRTAADETELLTIATAPDHRRAGVAHALLKAVLQCAREADAIAMYLEVAADNSGALSLYRAYGFAQTGTRKGYYRRAVGAVDAVLLAKRLDNDAI